MFCLGLLAFLEGRHRPRWLLACSCFFAASMFTYPSARVFVPVFLLGLAALYGRSLWTTHRSATIAAIAFFLLLALPGVPYWIGPQGMARAWFLLDGPGQWLQQYLSYFAPDFLFFHGDPNVRHSMAGWGQLYLFEMATVPLGVLGLWQRRRQDAPIAALWLPLPAALTDAQHAVRASIGAPVWALLSALGIAFALDHFARRGRICLSLGIAAVITLHAAFYSHAYFTRYADNSALQWQFCIRDTYSFVATQQHNAVYISDRLPLPHIFALFYTRFPPAQYQQAPLQGLSQGNWSYSDFSFGRYHIDSTADILGRACEDALVVVFADESEPFRHDARYALRKVVTVPSGERLVEIFSCR